MLLSSLWERRIGAVVMGALTLWALVMIYAFAPQVHMFTYRSTFSVLVSLVGAFSMTALLLYRKGHRRFIFAPRSWNWWGLGLLSSSLCGALTWLLTLRSEYVLVLAHSPSVIVVAVLLMYRLEAPYEPVERVRIRELTDAEWLG